MHWRPIRSTTMGTLSSSLRLARSQEGFILPIVLVLFAIGALLITPTLGHGYASLGASTVTEIKAEQLHAADSGVEEGLYWLTRNRIGDQYEPIEGATNAWTRANPYVLNDQYVYVTIEHLEDEEEDHLYQITSRAEDANGAGSTVLAIVYAVPFITVFDEYPEINQHNIPEEDLYVDNAGGDALVISGNPTVQVNIVVTGDVIIDNNATIEGNLSVGGDLTLVNNIDINVSQICLAGDLRLGNNSELDGIVLGEESEPLTIYLTAQDQLVWLENNAQIYGDIYTHDIVTVRLDHPETRVFGTIHACGAYFQHELSHQLAQFPEEGVCDDRPFPCSGIPENRGEILIWEIT